MIMYVHPLDSNHSSRIVDAYNTPFSVAVAVSKHRDLHFRKLLVDTLGTIISFPYSVYAHWQPSYSSHTLLHHRFCSTAKSFCMGHSEISDIVSFILLLVILLVLHTGEIDGLPPKLKSGRTHPLKNAEKVSPRHPTPANEAESHSQSFAGDIRGEWEYCQVEPDGNVTISPLRVRWHWWNLPSLS